MSVSVSASASASASMSASVSSSASVEVDVGCWLQKGEELKETLKIEARIRLIGEWRENLRVILNDEAEDARLAPVPVPTTILG